MNIFILNTGRCGSSTFIKACSHITNFTAAHESLLTEIGESRLDYPENHIEADNRLSWFLGRLDITYGDSAYYVHLKRNNHDTATSFSKRTEFGILKAYKQGILLGNNTNIDALNLAHDYIDTVDSNIELFLKDKNKKTIISLETIKSDFEIFWNKINAQGELKQALKEWDINYNAS